MINRIFDVKSIATSPRESGGAGVFFRMTTVAWTEVNLHKLSSFIKRQANHDDRKQFAYSLRDSPQRKETVAFDATVSGWRSVWKLVFEGNRIEQWIRIQTFEGASPRLRFTVIRIHSRRADHPKSSCEESARDGQIDRGLACDDESLDGYTPVESHVAVKTVACPHRQRPL